MEKLIRGIHKFQCEVSSAQENLFRPVVTPTDRYAEADEHDYPLHTRPGRHHADGHHGHSLIGAL